MIVVGTPRSTQVLHANKAKLSNSTVNSLYSHSRINPTEIFGRTNIAGCKSRPRSKHVRWKGNEHNAGAIARHHGWLSFAHCIVWSLKLTLFIHEKRWAGWPSYPCIASGVGFNCRHYVICSKNPLCRPKSTRNYPPQDGPHGMPRWLCSIDSFLYQLLTDNQI